MKARIRGGIAAALLVLSVSLVAFGQTPGAVATQDNPVNAGQVNTKASGTVSTASCAVTKQSFAESSDGQATSSSSFVKIPGTSVTFKTGGSGKSCLTVEFTAQAYAQAASVEVIQAALDGSTGAQVSLAGSDGMWASAHAFVFSFKDVSPGRHTVKILWRSANGGSVSISYRTLVVFHR